MGAVCAIAAALEDSVIRTRAGVTLVEVLIAIVVLSIGILALTGSSALATRMIGSGNMETHAALRAASRVELLRAAANSTTPHCQAPTFSSGGPVLSDALAESWAVSPSGSLRGIRVIVSYRTVHGMRSALLESRIAC
jgi:prepilin-type N-terminal cleavage/methylation domain-containing protein